LVNTKLPAHNCVAWDITECVLIWKWSRTQTSRNGCRCTNI